MRTTLLFILLFTYISISAQNDSILTTKKINEITEFVENKKAFYNSPSIAVAITDQHNTIYLKHFGDAQKGDKYLIGSNSKSFTALLTLLLQEKGILSIDDPVNKYLDWFEYKNKNISDKITLKNLLQHTSGISTSIGETFIENDTSFNYKNYYAQILKKLEPQDLSEQPYMYSNANYRLLGFVIEHVTGMKFEDCLYTYITKPMNLNETSTSSSSNLIDSYQYFLYYPILKFKKSFHDQEIPSGLISSTANDMAIYLRQLMNSYNNDTNTILNPNTTKQLFTPNQNNKSGYGLGWRIFNDIFYHNGTNKSFESSMYMLPSINKSIVVLINSNQTPSSEIIDGIASILMDQKYNNTSSFRYYRNLPVIVLLLFAIFLFQIKKWKRLSFPIKLSRKIFPNLLLISGFLFSITILVLFPKLNGANLKLALQFDPTSGYSVILIAVLLFLISLIIYFNKAKTNFKQKK
ncbi:serine hydrolase domain-containing protein [Aquimarina rhabdastrellae]